MSKSPKIPTYRLHKQSGQAIVTLRDGLGGRRDVLLGPHDTPESRAEYARVIAEWEAQRHRLPAPKGDPALSRLSVNELILAYFRHVEGYYRHPDGAPTSEVKNIRLALRWPKKLYGHSPVWDFDSLALLALREKMIEAGLCRSRINKDVDRIRRMFKWGASQKLVPLEVHQSLATVEGLRAGRSDAVETDPVTPVPPGHVDAVLPHLLPQTAALVKLQSLTGMRPGEVVVMRTVDIDTSGEVWLYRPGSDQGRHGKHKTAWRGKGRVIHLGPQAQELLRPWLRPNPQEYLFQPREAEAQRDAERRRARKSKVTPSQAARRPKQNPKKAPGEKYTPSSYAHAIDKACKKGKVPHWSPNQLRHTFATEIRRKYGLEGAQVALGHASADVTQVYAERDMALAEKIARQIG